MGNTKTTPTTSPRPVDDTMEFADPTTGDSGTNTDDTSRQWVRSVLAGGAVASALACTAAYRRRRAQQNEQQSPQPAPSPTNFAAPKTV